MLETFRQFVQHLMSAEPHSVWIFGYFTLSGFFSAIVFYFLNSTILSASPQTKRDEKLAAVFHFVFGGVIVPLLIPVAFLGILAPTLVNRILKRQSLP